MSVYEPQNPDDSDSTFQHILEHSHFHPATPKPPARNPELDKLTKSWKEGKLSHHDYMVQKYALERNARNFSSKRNRY